MGGPVWIRQWPGSVRWFEAAQTSDLLQGPSKENPRGGKIRFERLRLRLCGKDCRHALGNLDGEVGVLSFS